MKTLIVVESPNKINSIKKILGKDYDVVASFGHIMDLAKGGNQGIGIDVNNNFKPYYVILKDKLKVIDDIINAASNADEVILCSDHDREGEAIASHLHTILKSTGKPMYRAEFNEITKTGIDIGIKNKHDIDMNIVRSQEARRILDRIVGFMVSPYLMSFYGPNLSAGRVQSVAVRMIVEKEREIEQFKPEEYWNVNGKFKDQHNKMFTSKLERKLSNKNETDETLVFLDENKEFIVSSVKRQSKKENPPPPLTTASLQRYMSRKHSFEPERTMKAAQNLYENGYCTYIRTDSTRISDEAIVSVRDWIADNKYDVPKSPNEYKMKDNAQNAHECIRPTNMANAPGGILRGDDNEVYAAIWQHFIASQMNPAIWDTLVVKLISSSNKDIVFKSIGKALKYKGFLDILGDVDDSQIEIPNLSEKDKISLVRATAEQKFTQPPPRYNNDAILKELEDRGIGRPSTFADIIKKITGRNYVEKQGATYRPTDLGRKITGILTERFQFMEYDFSAKLEKQLDDIADGKLDYIQMLKEFFQPFKIKLNDAYVSNGCKLCDKCGSAMLERTAKNGSKFMGCTAFPRCKMTQSIAISS